MPEWGYGLVRGRTDGAAPDLGGGVPTALLALRCSPAVLRAPPPLPCRSARPQLSWSRTQAQRFAEEGERRRSLLESRRGAFVAGLRQLETEIRANPPTTDPDENTAAVLAAAGCARRHRRCHPCRRRRPCLRQRVDAGTEGAGRPGCAPSPAVTSGRRRRARRAAPSS